MLKGHRNHCLSHLLVVVIALFTATACSTARLERQENGITIERINSDGARISHVYLTRTGDQFLLRGKVKRRFPGRGPIPGHLHVTLRDPQGKVFTEADIDYARRRVNASIATFNIELPVGLTPGSAVQITHFTSESHKIIPKERLWREKE